MKWLNVIIFAVIAGLYTGIIMLIPPLKETSFQDIGIMYEWWVVFAVIIVVNCRKNWEAMLKCFAFFIISQPLIYGVEILFGQIDFSTALNYYKGFWLPMTFLTLPGGFIAFYCKKQNAIGSIVLGIGNVIQSICGIMYAVKAVTDFPHHLLSAIVCFGSAIIMVIFIQKEKKNRIISFAATIIITALIIAFIKSRGLYIVSNIF